MPYTESMIDTIKTFMLEQNIDQFGTAVIETDRLPFAALPYAVSFAVPLSGAVVQSIKAGPTKLYFHHYRTTNALIDNISLRLCLKIRSLGYDALYIPASQSVSEDGFRGEFSHKMAAVQAGLGGIGRNDLFLNVKYGAAVRLGTVFTDAPLPASEPVPNPCTGCNACTKACPSGAIAGRDWQKGVPVSEMVDVALCSHHMKTAYQHIGRGAVCGICMAVCPVGK